MSSNPLRFALVASTAGSVLNEALRNDFFRSHVHALIVDQPCPAIEKGRAHGIHVEELFHEDPEPFGEALLAYCQAQRIDYVFSFYTQFYSKTFRDAYDARIINFHPSILPAFKGMDGFGDQVRYFVRFIGGTVEFIEDVMDEGKIIMQHLFPYDDRLPIEETRHRLFEQQCRCILQVARWLVESRISVKGRKVDIGDARYDQAEFSPALDWDEARSHEVAPRA